jgi:hypothetical protein
VELDDLLIEKSKKISDLVVTLENFANLLELRKTLAYVGKAV